MQIFLIILSIVIVVSLGFVIFLLTKKTKQEEPKEDVFKKIEELVFRYSSDVRRELNERLKENRESLERTSQGLHGQISSFTAGITKMDAALKQVSDSVKEVSSFQQIFRAPKLRGRWGELALEHILSQYFPKDMFILQYGFNSGEAVDAVLKLPNDKLLPIDAKFPHENFERMTESKNNDEREISKKDFAADIKREIDDIAKKYILPSESTTNIALMYIPAEAVYFEIINSLPEINDYARSKKILLASPNTFYLMIQIIQHWAHDLQIGRQTQNFIKKMERIVLDAKKLDESFSKLGKHLNDARSAYEDSDKRLELLSERTEKLIELEDTEKLLDGGSKKDSPFKI